MPGDLHHFTELLKIYFLGFTEAVRNSLGLFRIHFSLWLISCVALYPKCITRSALRVAQKNCEYTVRK